MKTIQKIGSLLCLAMFLSTASVAQKSPQKEAEKFFREIMQREHIPGLAYAVVKDGKVVSQEQFGAANLSWNAPVDKETVFQTASCSKLFSALLLGRLFDEKILLPGQTMGELLDSIPANWKPITIQQLAAHQSGINIADFSRTKTTKEAFELAKKQEMTYEPGTKSFYVSSDYWILQYIIEKKLGKPYFEALKSYVLDPLGMQHTFVNNNDDSQIRSHAVLPKEAAVYAYQNGSHKVSDMQFVSTGYTAGGIYTSITDMARIAQTLDDGKILTPATQALLLTNASLKTGGKGDFGIGFHIENHQGHKISGHSGGPALADFVRFDDKKTTFIVLTNLRGFYPYLAKKLATFYIPGLKNPELPPNYWLALE
ncbi:serine hydrolase domain-containing protein [Rufibacter roseolus]|uniref:serine hydrolase domain-containing protein n=1 Tax=Rufibacter roseolus TaxID=2817375 RepID=UPI001B306916|nr:serine hydrolase domain-containing protein [Rufibacter roseolus]